MCFNVKFNISSQSLIKAWNINKIYKRGEIKASKKYILVVISCDNLKSCGPFQALLSWGLMLFLVDDSECFCPRIYL